MSLSQPQLASDFSFRILKFIQLKMQTMLSKKEKLKNCFIYRIFGPIMVVTWEGLVCHKLTLLRTMTHLLIFLPVIHSLAGISGVFSKNNSKKVTTCWRQNAVTNTIYNEWIMTWNKHLQIEKKNNLQNPHFSIKINTFLHKIHDLP